MCVCVSDFSKLLRNKNLIKTVKEEINVCGRTVFSIISLHVVAFFAVEIIHVAVVFVCGCGFVVLDVDDAENCRCS